jgi:hypothetical protein
MIQFLQRTFKTSTVLFLLAVSAGCASGAKINSDYDGTADFGSYKTWEFIEDAGPDYDGYESLFSQHMMEAIEIEMDLRGYVRSSDPDIYLNFNAFIQDKTKVTQSPSMGPPMGMGGYYGYRGGYYGAWGGYGYGTETRVSQYTQGTFNIDIIDAKRMQLIWEAVAVGKVTDKHRENLRETVMNGVPEFFAHYPFTAGSSVKADTTK